MIRREVLKLDKDIQRVRETEEDERGSGDDHAEAVSVLREVRHDVLLEQPRGVRRRHRRSNDVHRGVFHADGGCGAHSGYYETKWEAAAAWNRRAERTCRVVHNEDGYPSCSECGAHYLCMLDASYCPDCGAKVVGE